MPVSKKPRRRYAETTGPNPYTRAGTLLYSFYELAALARRVGQDATIEQIQRHTRQKERSRRRVKFTNAPLGYRTRHNRVILKGNIAYAPSAGSESTEARRRRGQKLTQHPSVVERFKNQAQIEAAAA